MTEEKLIEILKKEVETFLKWGESSFWHNQNFKSLSEQLEEASGISISVTTLKRFFGKAKYESKPSIATLNALTQLIGYEDWQNFVYTKKSINKTQPSKTSKARSYILIGIIAFLSLLIISVLYFYFNKKKLKVATSKDEITFKVENRIDSFPGIMRFKYDFSNINPEAKPNIRLYYNDNILDTIPLSQQDRLEGTLWKHQAPFPGLYDVVLFDGDKEVIRDEYFSYTSNWICMPNSKDRRSKIKFPLSPYKNGICSLTDSLKDIYTQEDNLDKYTFAYHHPKLREVSSTDYTLDFKVKNSGMQLKDNMCSILYLTIFYEKGYLSFNILRKECSTHARIFSKTAIYSGQQMDLNMLTVNMDNWHKVHITSKNGKVKIEVGKKKAIEIPADDWGQMTGYKFSGNDVEIDYIKQYDQTSKLIYAEDFD